MAPPRKSAEGVSTPSKKPATTETGESSNSAASKKDGGSKEGGKDSTSQGLNVEDLRLPRSVIQRMARAILADGTSMQRDAVTAWSRGATVFVNYLASTASDRAVLSGKKTVQHHDVLEALDEIDFADFVQKTENELAEHRSILTTKRTDYRNRVAAASSTTGANATSSDQDNSTATAPTVSGREQHDDDEAAKASTPKSASGKNGTPRVVVGSGKGKGRAEEDVHRAKKPRLDSEAASGDAGGGDTEDEDEEDGEEEFATPEEGDELSEAEEEDDDGDEDQEMDEDDDDEEEGDVVEDLDVDGADGQVEGSSQGEDEESE